MTLPRTRQGRRPSPAHVLLCTLALIASAAAGGARAQDAPRAGTAEAVAGQLVEIESLAAAAPQPDVDVHRLLGVDPLDDAAVADRIAEIEAAMEGFLGERRAILPDDGSGASPDDGDDDSGGPHGLPLLNPDDALRVAQIDLLIRRERAKIDFLSSPPDRRAAAMRAVDDARRLRAEREAAEVARREAEEAARQAEAARLAALERARQARTQAAAELASEQARVEEVRRAVAEQQQAYAGDQLQRAEASLRRTDVAERIDEAVAGGDVGAAQAERLYDGAVDALAEARESMAEALAEGRSPSRYPGYEPTLGVGEAAYVDLEVARERLIDSNDALDRERRAAVEAERIQRWEVVDGLAHEVFRLNDARLALLPMLGDARREAVLGIGPEGLGQLLRELTHLRLMTGWYSQARLRSLGQASAWALDVFGRSSGRWNLVLLLVVLVGGAHTARRRKQLADWLDDALRAAIDDDDLEQRALRWTGWVRALAVPLLRLVAFGIGAAAAYRLLPCEEVALAGRIALTFAAYSLLQAFIHHFLIAASAATLHQVTEDVSERLRRSIRLMLRYALVVTLFLEIAAAVLGRGYLYTLVQDFAWLGAIPILLLLLRRWRDEVFDAFEGSFPQSRLLAPLRRARGKLSAPVAILPAALLLLFRAVWLYVRTTALRFERTRRALAYLFRRRLQTQAETLGHGTHDIAALPDELRATFRRPPDEDLKVAHFPGLDDTVSAIVRSTGGDAGCAIAVVGQRGVGKTAWLEELRGRLPAAPVTLGSLDGPMADQDTALEALCTILDIDACRSVDEMVAALLAGTPRVILLDRCQNLALRAVRGMDGYRALTAVIRRTSSHLCWICSFSQFTWEYLQFATRGQDLFHQVIRLPGWPEAAIRELVERRMDASGVACSFDDLVDEDVPSRARNEVLQRTRERFMRLLWDYTDGIPRLAMYFWLRSLVPDAEGTLRVRPFDGPGPDDLETLGEKARFVLNAVISHEDLTVDEAVLVLQYRPDSCLAVLEQLRARGHLTREGDRYRPTHHWDRAAVRYLRRKHLLYL